MSMMGAIYPAPQWQSRLLANSHFDGVVAAFHRSGLLVYFHFISRARALIFPARHLMKSRVRRYRLSCAKGPVLPHLPSSLYLDRVTRQQVGAAAVVLLAGAGIAWYTLTRKQPTPEEVERQRRTLLALSGRVTDGSIVGVDESTEETSSDGMVEMPLEDEQEPPRVLIYRYRCAGVTYECAQDVSQLAEKVRNIRIDLPVQVRYDPGNPADSILVAEEWSGLQQEVMSTPEVKSVRRVDGVASRE